jgi:predicted nucleic acid-binding protein
MVLVDISVLIPFLKNMKTAETAKLNEIMERSIPYGICNIVYQELLQGVRTENQFEMLKQYLDTQRFYDLKTVVSPMPQQCAYSIIVKKRVSR